MSDLNRNTNFIEGIGPARAQALTAAGVVTVGHLLAAHLPQLRYATGLSVRVLDQLRGAATLLRVDTMTPDLAEALTAAGLTTLSQVADAGLQTLERAAKKAVKNNTMSEEPTLYQLAAIQRHATRLLPLGGVTGTVNEHDGDPASGAVLVRQQRCELAGGHFSLDELPSGSHRLRISTSTRAHEHVIRVSTTAGRIAGPTRITLPTAAADLQLEKVTTSEADGVFVAPDPRKTWKLRWGETSGLHVGQDLLVRRTSTRYRLLDINRTQVGKEVFITRYRVDVSDLPPGAADGDVVRWGGATFASSPLDQAALRQQRYNKVTTLHPAKVTITLSEGNDQ